MAQKNKKVFICESCGNEATTWAGRCGFCGEWNTLKEVSLGVSVKSDRKSEEINIMDLKDIEVKDNYRIKTNISEFDRVLGGGIVPGSIILLGGEPGIGKSTVLLQVANSVSKTFYVSAEESLAQIKIRADRLAVKGEIELASTGDLESLEKDIIKKNPGLLIVDSIQTVYLDSIPSTPGSVVQVRECGMFLQHLAKRTGIPIVIVGHVTKDGSLAGPRILEHLVDVVLYLEGERFHDARVLRGVKNRFGATNEVGIFSMGENGMMEIKNPSKLFLSERQQTPGSVVTSTMEGTRPILIEIQALTMPTHFGYPKRTSSGFDLNRLNLLEAVITKTTKCNLSNYDIYLNVVGGMKLNEPAIDLAVCIAIVSSYKNKPIPKDLCVFGEVGLSGEVRSVTRQKDRKKEATNLGYKTIDDIQNVASLIATLGM